RGRREGSRPDAGRRQGVRSERRRRAAVPLQRVERDRVAGGIRRRESRDQTKTQSLFVASIRTEQALSQRSALGVVTIRDRSWAAPQAPVSGPPEFHQAPLPGAQAADR